MAWYAFTGETVRKPLPIAVDRPFELNAMIPTHAQLLLRGRSAGVYEERIDIVFKDLRALRAPRSFPSLRLRHAVEDERREVRAEVPERQLRHAAFYVIEAEPKFAYIVAGSAYMATDREPDPSPSPLLHGDTVSGTWPDTIVHLV